MTLQSLSFLELSTDLLYQILQLRMEVFVVEQTCYYQDADGLDKHPETQHVILWDGDQIAAYARVLAPGTSYDDYSSIGRILNPMAYRGRGLGHKIVAGSIALCEECWPDVAIKISAQAHLQGFYDHHGFAVATEVYLEDGIEHIGMIRDSHAL